MAYADRAKKQAYQARWDKAKADRWRAVGACVECGLPTPINVETGKAFTRCFPHRVYYARAQTRYRRRLKRRLTTSQTVLHYSTVT